MPNTAQILKHLVPWLTLEIIQPTIRLCCNNINKYLVEKTLGIPEGFFILKKHQIIVFFLKKIEAISLI